MDKINGRTPEEIKREIIDAMEEATLVVEWGDAHDLIDAVEIAHEKMAHALAYIQQLEAQVPRWVSVEERLPEKHGQYCVGLYNTHGVDKSHLFPYVFIWHAYGDNGYVNGPHFSDEGMDGLKVYYWMPLPKAPKEG